MNQVIRFLLAWIGRILAQIISTFVSMDMSRNGMPLDIAKETPPPPEQQCFRIIVYPSGNTSVVKYDSSKCVSHSMIMSGLCSFTKVCSLALFSKLLKLQQLRLSTFKLLSLRELGFALLHGKEDATKSSMQRPLTGMDHLTKNNVINKYQHGFRPQYS